MGISTRAGRVASGVLCGAMVGSAWPAPSMAAAPAVPSRITETVNAGDSLLIAGNTHPLARVEFDRGLADPDRQFTNLILVLQRSPEQERALAAFNERQYDPNSPDYHHWLEAEEFGQAYGVSDADITAVSAWLQSHGLRVDGVAEGRTTIEFSGTVGQLQNAFQVQMHRYAVDGIEHVANDRDPRIPRALAPVVNGVAGMTDFPVTSGRESLQYVERDSATGKLTLLNESGGAAKPQSPEGIQPEFGYNDFGVTLEDLTPYDLATIYNSLPLWHASSPINGKGVTVAVVAQTDVAPSDYATYRKSFGLPATTVNVIHTGTDPGLSGAEENTEDVEMVGAAAPGATIDLVVAPSGGTLGDLITAISYVINHNVAPIMTASYGVCEFSLGSSGNAALNSIWQQGATQGISIFVSAGDQGSAGCSSQNGAAPNADSTGMQVNGLASSPYVTAVGGTDFTWNWLKNGTTTYWNTTNSAQGASAKGYIPEMTWNSTCANPLMVDYFVSSTGVPQFATTEAVCNAAAKNSTYRSLVAIGSGSGGISDCTAHTGTTIAGCSGGYAKPTWQTGTGVPADGKRDVPDIAMFGSYGWPSSPLGPESPLVFGSAYLICYSGGGHACSYNAVGNIVYQRNGGTSAASPYSAGVMALVIQKMGGARQGLANPTFYKLASREMSLSSCNSNTVTNATTCVFHDITFGSNAEVCKTGDPNCVTKTSGDKYGILGGYAATAGYDLTTGLGSMDIANLVDAWASAAPVPSISSTPSTLKFAATAVGSTSATQTVTLKNTGTVVLTFASGGITLTGGRSTSFTKTTTCAAYLIVGASCTITVSFKPLAAGSLTATLSIADNAAGSPQKITLSGIAIAPAVKWNATTLTFAATTHGTSSAAQTLTLTNDGTAVLAIASVKLGGTNPTDFVESSACAATLAASASCKITLSFKPATTGALKATVILTDNATGSPQSVALSGTGK